MSKSISVTVTLNLEPYECDDSCEVATFLGDVREALLAGERFSTRHADRLVGLVGESTAGPDATYRHPFRVPSAL